MNLTAKNARDILQAAVVVSRLDPDKEWGIEVKQLRGKRSSQQNRLLWAIYTGIANFTGFTTEEVHEACKRKFLVPRVIQLGEDEIEVPGSTAQQDPIEFSEYVERVQALAAELGVPA